MSTTVIRKACAQFPGFVLRAVTPFPADARDPRRAFFFAHFSKNRPRAEKSLETLIPGYLEDTFWAPENFPVFSIFQPSQHRPHLELREPGSELRNPGFPFFTGGRDSEGTGVWSLGSEVAGFGFPTPRSIYTYSRSPAPAAVMLIYTKAIDDLERLLELDPENAEASNAST